jgi:hypothetical protein
MLSQIVHSISVFRLSTGVIIGLITIIFYFKDNKIFKKFLYFLIFCLLFSSGYNINNFYKSKINYAHLNLNYYRFEKLPKNISNFYQDFFSTVTDVKSHYAIKKNFNYTHMPMLAFLSGTSSHQIGTYYELAVEKFYSQIPEFIKLNNSLQSLDDVIIFYPSYYEDIVDEKFINNFFIYKSIYFPYFDNKNYTQLLIPKNAKKLIR